MLLRNKSTNEQYHVPSGVGKAMIHAGLAEEVIPAAPKQTPKTNWAAQEGRYAGIDYQFPPFIVVGCSTCGRRHWITKEIPTFAFRHCGVVEPIPNTLRADYDRLAAAYNARSKKKEPALTSDTTAIEQKKFAVDRQLLLQQHVQLNEVGRKKG